VLRRDLRLEPLDILTIVRAELAVNCLELLLQIELALVLKERTAYVVVDLSLEAQQLDFRAQYLGEHSVECEQR
jgi:hypothetical protein